MRGHQTEFSIAKYGRVGLFIMKLNERGLKLSFKDIK